jgi:hypothetical protein
VFADGTDATGDVLTGADGIHSTVRKLLDPAAPAPTYTGLINPNSHGITLTAWGPVFGGGPREFDATMTTRPSSRQGTIRPSIR